MRSLALSMNYLQNGFLIWWYYWYGGKEVGPTEGSGSLEACPKKIYSSYLILPFLPAKR